ncbi:hypothetical protein ACLGIH_34865 [Streptomyces sp. HMX87]|uniref:hypothetical protein n=1 Tax=Streptomyces sp. HMX87 TaxID=3390849 RepID=UPI003A8BD759
MRGIRFSGPNSSTHITRPSASGVTHSARMPGGKHRYFDPDTLAPVAAPRPLLDAGWDPRLVHTVAGSADGRFAVVNGFLAPKPDGVPAHTMALYDFHHPLARLLRPVGSLNQSDLTALADATAPGSGTPHRETLALLHAVATAVRGGR